MSPRLPRVTAPQALRALKRSGWYEHRQTPGGHVQLKHPDRPERRVTIPMHSGVTLSVKTLATILDQAGLTADEFRQLL